MTSVENQNSVTLFQSPNEADSKEGGKSPRPWQRFNRWISRKLRDVMPRRLFARSLIIIVAPVVITQGVVTYIFFERHWDKVTRHLSEGVAGDIAMLIETQEAFPDIESITDLSDIAWRTTGMRVDFEPGETLPTTVKTSFFSVLDRTLRNELEQRIEQPFWFDTTRYPNWVDIRIQQSDGVLRIWAQRERVFATNGHIFVLWMIVTSLVILTVAIIFLRNQVRPIQRLAEAATLFGKGRDAAYFKPSGAAEVRRAAEAFLEMRDRIKRQIDQRTLLLAGVSHDLRTPLTRMKLQTALMDPTDELDALQNDLAEMEHMLEEYLAFARGQGSEAVALVDLEDLLRQVVDGARRSGQTVALETEGDLRIAARRNALKRCLTNLVDNGVEYGTKVAVTARRRGRSVEIAIDDDGPGIPADQTEEAFKPFNRLDDSRNLDKGGVGLGLAIAQDIARGHGGEITLVRSPWNGLRALVKLPL